MNFKSRRLPTELELRLVREPPMHSTTCDRAVFEVGIRFPEYGASPADRLRYEHSSTDIHTARAEWSARHWLMLGLVLLVAASISVGVAVSVAYSQDEEEAKEKIQKGAGGTSEAFPVMSSIEILKQSPLIDGHNDWPWNLRAFVQNKLSKVDISQDLRNVEPWATSPWSHTDIPSLREGHVAAQFWAAYVPCESQHLNAVQLTLEQIDVIKRFTHKYPKHFKFVTSAHGIEEAFAEDRIASLIGVEGGHSIGNSLAVLRLMYDMGVRYLTLTHNCHTPWADSHLADREDQALHHGLTEFGKLVVMEMNRLGMLVDLAHVSIETMNDALDTSRAPVIFSHSSAHALCNSTRNVHDHILRRVSKNEGMVMVNFFSPFISCGDTATLAQVADHIIHISKVAGIDHVGIGGDFDGINRVPKGLEDVSKYPHLLTELANRGWSSVELKKVAGLNFLRVFKKVEELYAGVNARLLVANDLGVSSNPLLLLLATKKVRDAMAAQGMDPIEELIPPHDLDGSTHCTYEFA